MTFDEYQKRAMATAIYPNIGSNLPYAVMGLAGEVGEVANAAKKVLRDDGGIITEAKRQQLAGEVADCLWYCAAVVHELGLSLGDIAQGNLNKLASRQQRGTLSGSGDNR